MNLGLGQTKTNRKRGQKINGNNRLQGLPVSDLYSSQLHASRDDFASPRPTRIPPRFRRGGSRSTPSTNNIGGMEFDSGGGGASGRGRGTPLSPPMPPMSRGVMTETAIDEYGTIRRAPLQKRLQDAPIILRETAIDLREDARDRVHDIRVRFDHFASVLFPKVFIKS